MKIASVTSLAIPDIKVIRFDRFADARGYFVEPFRESDIQRHPAASRPRLPEGRPVPADQ